MLGDHPEYIYWALVFLIAFPLALVSRVAAVVAVVRVLNQAAWDLGLPEPGSQAVIFTAGLVASVILAKSQLPLLMVAMLYAPLIALSVWQVHEPWLGWWAIFWVLVMQVLLLPFAVDWTAERRRIRRWVAHRTVRRGLEAAAC